MYYLGNNNNNTEGYISMAPTMMSSSAPTRPSIFLHLNSVDPVHTSSLSYSSQNNDYMEMKSPMGEGLILFSEIVYESNINNTKILIIFWMNYLICKNLLLNVRNADFYQYR